MLPLNRRLAEEYMRDTRASRSGCSAAVPVPGVRALVAGEADVGAASRPLLPDEVRAIHDRFGTLGVRFLVAEDALSVYVNDANPVTGLTTDQLAGIFSGRIRGWAEVGVQTGQIAVVVCAHRAPEATGSFEITCCRGGGYVGDGKTTCTNHSGGTSSSLRSEPMGPSAYGGVAFSVAGVRDRVEIDGWLRSAAEGRRMSGLPPHSYLALYTVAPPAGAGEALHRLVPRRDAARRSCRRWGYLDPLWPR